MRLEITRRTDLATRALLELHRRGDKTKSADLAAELGTTPGFLSHAMTPLIGRGWVRSEPGPTGGYRLVTPLAGISVLQVIETIEGPTDTERCVLEKRLCSGGVPCALHQPWAKARGQLLGELGRTTLATLARRKDRR
jgi:Rrf2 family iron-sulfur cluster assembly transcriptional regulator